MRVRQAGLRVSQPATGRATLDWLGCATFRLVRDDLVVFLDAYIDRVPSAPPTGVTIAAIDRADWIVVGHSHFDHLWGAERIASRPGRRSSARTRACASWPSRACLSTS